MVARRVAQRDADVAGWQNLRELVRSRPLTAFVLAQNIACKPGNFVELSLGTDMLCGEHPNGRWDCFQPNEQGHARRFDLPRDDYVFVSPDGGSACAIRPEDSGVDCFGENAPTPPAMQLAALRYVAPDLVLGDLHAADPAGDCAMDEGASQWPELPRLSTSPRPTGYMGACCCRFSSLTLSLARPSRATPSPARLSQVTPARVTPSPVTSPPLPPPPRSPTTLWR